MRAAAGLRRDRQRAVFDEAAVDRTGAPIFSRAVRPPAAWRRATACGAAGIEREGVAIDHALQVGPDRIEVGGALASAAAAASLSAGSSTQQHLVRRPA